MDQLNSLTLIQSPLDDWQEELKTLIMLVTGYYSH